jgi:putative protein kinase ArgK-like GTPase of G3E family
MSVAVRDVSRAGATPASSLGIDPCLERLARAVDASHSLGIPTAEAQTVLSDARERLGFPSDAYVVALVGGTGVGKSSLLNALAGKVVTRASARRPTTVGPIALVPKASIADLGDLLDWLGVHIDDIHASDDSGLNNVALLDLPDIDSTAPDHRDRVESILPRIDAVIWVTDPEKYGDAVLHDEFFARWLPRLAHQLVVINKVDRVTEDESTLIRRDLGLHLARLATASRPDHHAPQVVLASATHGHAQGSGMTRVDELRNWLNGQAEAKAVIRARLAASIRDAVLGLARAAGVDPGRPAVPLVHPEVRRAAIDGVVDALLRIVDLTRLEQQAIAATRVRARARGAGPLSGLTSFIYRWSGRESRVADPVRFLAGWRQRGGLGAAVEAIRAAMSEPLRTAPPGMRHLLAATVAVDRVERGLARTVDRAVASRGDDLPSSGLWPVLGVLQRIVILSIAVTAIWVALWVFVKFPVDSLTLPVVGRLPAPFVVLVSVLAAGYLLARLLGVHAGWIGRRWARGLAADIRANVERQVADTAFGALDAIETERRVLRLAADEASRDCATS